jgi:plastocyanin
MNNTHEITQPDTSEQRRHRKVALLTASGLVAAGAIALAALGFGGGGSAGGTGMAGMAGMAGMSMEAGTANNAPVASDSVAIKNFGFSSATITVTAGSTVVWTNDDSVQHDVTFDGGGIASDALNHNDTFSHTFPTAGTYHYICSIHPFMHGTVIVTPGSNNGNATQSQPSAGYGY